MYKFGQTQKKIMVALLGGVALGLSSSPRQFFRTLKVLKKDWDGIKQSSFDRSIGKLAEEKLLVEKKFPDGSLRLVLTKEGERQAKKINLLGNSINFKKPKKWDGRWRIVIFDIPEKDRIFRGILREHLYELKFRKLQNSVFVSPHPFEKMILELTALYSAQEYVRVITATAIDNEANLKKHFFTIRT